MGRRGPKGMSPARQELANVRKSRRTNEIAPAESVEPLAAKPPAVLKAPGKNLWNVICAQQASLKARGIAPTVTEAEAPLLLSYCISFERFQAATRVIKAREEEYPPAEKWRARMIDMADGDQKLHGAYRIEREESVAMAKAAAALGVAKNSPAIAVQVNQVQNAPAPSGDGLLAMDRHVAEIAAQGEIIDAA